MIFGDVRQKKLSKLWFPYYVKTFDTRTFLKRRRVRPRCFSAIWEKKTSTGRSDTPLLIHELFPYWNFSERQKRSPTKFFGTVRLKVLHGKSWNSPIMHEILGCHNFFESLEAAPQIFRHCEKKTIDKIVIPYYPKASRYHKISETHGSPYENFRYCETKRIDRIVIPILSKKFGNQKNSENTDVFAHGDFWWCETKQINKIVILLLSKIFWYQNISETQKCSPTMFFGVLGQRNIDGKTWHPLLIHKLFPY